MNRNERFILFYSNNPKCGSSCSTFAKKLVDSGLINKFTRICIDDPKLKIPRTITSVPAIIIPQYKKPLMGSNAYTWLDTQIRQIRHAGNKGNSNGGKGGGNGGSNKPAELEAYTPSMNGRGLSSQFEILDKSCSEDAHGFSRISNNNNNNSDELFFENQKINTPDCEQMPGNNDGNNGNQGQSYTRDIDCMKEKTNKGMDRSFDKLLEERSMDMPSAQQRF
jgi:hypothetical protein